MSEYGVVTGAGTVRFERLLPGPVERVWAYLTESEQRGSWLAPGKMELRVGGRVELTFHHADLSGEKTTPARYRSVEGGDTLHGQVTRCEPPRVLSFTWDEVGQNSEVSFELTPRGEAVLLVLTHRRLGGRAERVSVASGWHTHLGILGDRLADREPLGFWSTHAQLEADYEQRVAE